MNSLVPRSARRFAALALAAAVPLLSAPAAGADTAPPVATTPPTVAADVLPTVQVNGVVWAQLVVGGTVYATGEFTSARPAGAASGTSETPRSNIIAYDLATGAMKTSFAPSLNAQGLTLAASADGATIYVGGDFTSVNGTNRYRIAALDATTGALRTAFAPVLDARVRSVIVRSGVVYAGGIFSTASGQPRTRLAAFDGTSGALSPWAPSADAEVMAMVAPPNSNKIVVGGRFANLNGAANYGLGALDATSAAVLPFPANQVVRNAGSAAAIYSLSADATQTYGTGYTFGSGGNLENTFAADTASGNLNWVDGCRGDTYSNAPIGNVIYIVGHSHDCSEIGAFPQTNPWTYQRAQALSTTRGANNKVNTGGSFPGRPAPDMYHWLPTLAVGSYTGQSQAAWSVAGNSNYVVLGGEFPSINGVAQQGLARFAVRSLAPNKEGPQGFSTLTPTFTTPSAGVVSASWTAAWDRDNTRLTYELLRGPQLSTATVVATTTLDTNWWTRPAMTLTDNAAPRGTTQTYRVRVTDPLGNVVVGTSATVNVTGTNQAPTARFTSSTTGLTASVDASTSTDADGTVASYAWNFGDGQTGTGATATHAYAAAGTYTVTLTVTDNGGATGTTSAPVTVAVAGAGTTVAADTFTRTVASGFGTADTGGAWTFSGAGTTASVGPDSGLVAATAGKTATLRLASVNNQDNDVTHTLWLEQVPTGGGEYLSTVLRSTAGGDYRARVRILATGDVQISLTKVVSGTETALTTSLTLPGLTYTAGTKLALHAQASGANPTTLRIKVWPAGTAEPAAWQQTVTDTTAGLQAPGAVGLVTFLSSSATATVNARFDDLKVVTL